MSSSVELRRVAALGHGGISKPEKRGQKYMLFVLLVGLGTFRKLGQHHVRDLGYNPFCAMIVISLVKMALSLGFFARLDGSWRLLIEHLKVNRRLVLCYSIVSGLFCAYDVLSFVNLRIFDPQTYMILLQLRTVLTGAIFEVVFRRPLRCAQRCALALICLACMVKQAGGSWSVAAASVIPPYALALLLIQVFADSLAIVANEVLLKEKAVVPLNLQNAILYAWAVLWCFIAGALIPVKDVRMNPLDPGVWAAVLDVHMVPVVATFAALGLLTALFIKRLDSVQRSIATTFELFLTSFGSAVFFGYHVTRTDLVALSILVSGVCLYASPPRARWRWRTSVVDVSKTSGEGEP